LKIEPKLELNITTILLLLLLATLVIWAYQVKQKGLIPSVTDAASNKMIPWFGQQGAPAWTAGVPPLMVLWDLFNG